MSRKKYSCSLYSNYYSIIYLKLSLFPGAGHCEDGSSLEPPELFCSLGSLIVEGRLPSDQGSRGYTEGPHVELPGRISRHKCSQTEYLVSEGNFLEKIPKIFRSSRLQKKLKLKNFTVCNEQKSFMNSLDLNI